ncbi:MAG TPA: OmpA family protein [Blastocatellia bacterium]|nr:OmpA family protein [Blastocatellia bacterium]
MTLALFTAAVAQDTESRSRTSNTNNSSASSANDEGRRISRAVSGQKQKIRGVIVKRDPDGFIMRDLNGNDWSVTLTNSTEVKERKSNPFRGAQKYATTTLLRGLNVEVEGQGDGSGAVVAKTIRTTQDELAMARTTETRVAPVEGRVGEAETRLTQAEANAQRLSGQIEELQAVSNAARGGAKAAQESADAAIAGVNQTNERISLLDDFEERKIVSVNFKVNSFVLSPEAKSVLDAIAAQAKTERGYVIEVAGHASADGKLELNRKLSQNRADAVIQYLVETHNIPQRRIASTFGYGISQPVADNTTREGREQNRRVDVKILVSKGLTSPINVTKPNPITSAVEPQRQNVSGNSNQ